MENCIFCKIIAKEIPAKIIFEDERMLAFEDINPQAPHHILLIPKEHLSSLNEIPQENVSLLGDLLLRARRLAEERGVSRKGYRIVLNTGRESGQAVFHIHFHLLAGRPMTWPPG